MANTKVTGDLIASLTIATGNIADNAVTSDKISGITTAHITEGANLYYTDARADARITAATTSDLSEGTNLYYTDARARGAVSVSGNALSYNSSTGVITSNFEESPTFTGTIYASNNNPAYSFASDTNTGMSRTGTHQIGFINQGNTSLTLDALSRATFSTSVGINTTPAFGRELLVKGEISALAQDSGDNQILMGATSTQTNISATYGISGSYVPMQFETGGSVRLTIDSSGNVGIGKSQSGNAALTVKSTAGGNTGLMLIEGDTTNDGHGLYATTDNKFVITRFTNGSYSDNFVMDSSGQVGIGTTGPPSKLTVMESALCTNSGSDAGQSYVPSKPILLVTTDGDGTPSSAYATNSVFTVGIGGGVTGGVTTEHLRVNLNGNVGIGTASPYAPLHISHSLANGGIMLGNTATTGSREMLLNIHPLGLIWQRWINGAFQTNLMTLDYDGNLGIGTTSPVSKLEVDGSIKVTGITSNIGADAGLSLSYDSGINYINTWASTPLITSTYNYQAFHISGSEKMRIHTDGNVGIGATSPAGKLEIKTGSSYTGHTQPNIKLINFGYRDAELNVFAEGSYFTHYFENYSGGSGRYYDRSLEIVCKGQPDGTYGEGVIKFKANPITAGSNVAEIMRITGAGKVGIGTTSPSKKLTVNGGMLVGNNNTDAGASQIYGDIRRPQSQYYCERIWKRNSGAAPSTYNVARQWHDHANWSSGHINVIIWGTGPTVSEQYKADFSCGYGYSGGSVHVSVNFNPGGLAVPVWGSAVQVNGNIHYRDLTITPPSYNTYVVQVINPGGMIQTYDINNTGQAIYFYPQ